jgi:HAE1 family hydrophobic/amphiphilic exporter-1
MIESMDIRLTSGRAATRRKTSHAMRERKAGVGPEVIKHYNLYPTAKISGQAAPGMSSGAALAKMEALCERHLPQRIGYDWTGMSYQEVHVGNTAIFIFALALAFGFLVLAAQYESWTAPLIIMMSVPLAVAGAIGAVALRMMDVNVYTQIGLVLLIGLSAKNAILIVEFARQKRCEEKFSIGQSAIEASRVRFRPILMTALSFILGVFPLVIASGAGAMSRQALGTAVFGGMISATFVGIFFIPILYVIVQSATEWRLGKGLLSKKTDSESKE